ncbi:hypothetical protein [Bradyrhizobium sp. AZCC 2289]|uniref:hypothetical protein n=1 Tax=Bradyrhizobium sp. AZCC 2289 TaxID=3117026 RepID=UPI002FF2AC0E
MSFGESQIELHPSPTWRETRPFVQEFFNFWLDGEDSFWAKTMWIGLENAGLFSNSGTGFLWTRSNVAALSLIYAESVCRLGLDFPSWIQDRSELIDIFKSYNDCEARLIEVRNAILIYFGGAHGGGQTKLFEFTLSNIVIGSNICSDLGEIRKYVKVCVKRLPNYTAYREDRLFELWSGGAILHPDYLECLP